MIGMSQQYFFTLQKFRDGRRRDKTGWIFLSVAAGTLIKKEV